MSNSKNYKIGIKNSCFNNSVFWGWMTYAFIQSAILFYFIFYTFSYSFSLTHGNTGDLLMSGTYAFGAIVIICNMQILYDTHSHYHFTIMSVTASMISFYVIFYLMNLIWVFEIYGYFWEMLSFPIFHIWNLFSLLVIFPFCSF
mmetsp:Transcript_29097/g.21639  ORF Transcript_29097/g.21639 Transcript_29097/m.21639 type:complete len:144 (+) Transcript_29097:1177-1608(+)